MAADLVGWAIQGKLILRTGIPPVSCGATPLGGMVIVPPDDIMRMFRRDISAPPTIHIRRIRTKPECDEWHYITEPREGIEVHRYDIIITADDAERFETDHDINRRSLTAPSAAKWDWEAWHVSLIKRVYEQGLPTSQNEWIRESVDWFASRSTSGEAPDESTLRRKIAPVWQALRQDERRV